MTKRFVIIILILSFSLTLLTGCWVPHMPVHNPPTLPDLPEFDESSESDSMNTLDTQRLGQFTLRYEPNSTMNPIFALNRDNISLTSLLYESLFILDTGLVESPNLVTQWSTEDNKIFTFRLMENVLMHDGAPLTVADVIYSIRQASQRGRHASKLRMLEEISADNEDEYVFTITLSSPNARFTRLLDIPIIRSGTIDMRVPPGTGPFIFAYDDAMQLTRFVQHRNYAQMPLSTVYLRQSSDGEITGLFDEGYLSLLWSDPTGSFDIRLNRMHEPRFFETTAMQFIGFNANSPALIMPDIRRAISSSINRQYIVDNIMNNPRPGQTVSSPLALSPEFDMYDSSWEPTVDSLHEMSALLERSGFVDFNEDGFLEMPDNAGGFREFTLDFIVNSENQHKIAAAEKIADDLRLFGIDVAVRSLPWDNFMEALENGNFDLYYGEVQLGADFDLSPLLLPGSHNINFGNAASSSFEPLINNFLAASTREEVRLYGGALVDEIRVSAPFAPILYKRHAIYSPTGVITGAVPSQSGVFHNFQEWSINLILLFS